MVKAQRAKRVKPMPPVAHSFCWPTAGSWTTKIPTRVAKIIYSTEMETMIPYLSCQQPLHQQRHLAKMTILVHEKIIKKRNSLAYLQNILLNFICWEKKKEFFFGFHGAIFFLFSVRVIIENAKKCDLEIMKKIY